MGLKLRCLHVLKGFVVDSYCHSLNLAIEIDGKIDGKIDERQIDYDLIRQKRNTNTAYREFLIF